VAVGQEDGSTGGGEGFVECPVSAFEKRLLVRKPTELSFGKIHIKISIALE